MAFLCLIRLLRGKPNFSRDGVLEAPINDGAIRSLRLEDAA